MRCTHVLNAAATAVCLKFSLRPMYPFSGRVREIKWSSSQVRKKMPRGICSSFFRPSQFRLSGGAAKPQWGVPRAQLWGPARGDKHHYGEHPSYNYFLLFIRGIRPKVESAAESAASIVKGVAFGILDPARTFVKAHNPDFRLVSPECRTFELTNDYAGNSAASINTAVSGRTRHTVCCIVFACTCAAIGGTHLVHSNFSFSHGAIWEDIPKYCCKPDQYN